GGGRTGGRGGGRGGSGWSSRHARGPPPPPEVGAHPMWGGRRGFRANPPVYTPRNTTERDVVVPGPTGLPSSPGKSRSIARSLNSASSPPTRNPRGHESWNCAPPRTLPSSTGTTTHGPRTFTQTCSPRHSLVAPA